MDSSSILQNIDLLKKEAREIHPAKPEYEKVFWDKYRLEFNYNSNHLEGNTLTYGHTQLLLKFDKVVADYTGREIEEMKAHDLAMKMIQDAAGDTDFQLTEKFIKEINEIILVRSFYKEAITPDGQSTRRLIEPGQYKKYPNSVRLENGEIFNYASPEETPAQMGDLLDWYRQEEEKKELHTVQLAALFHYRFVRIHPFDDSNGRSSRLLMNYILMKNGYAPIVIESSDKKNYLTALNKADVGDLSAFADYIINLSLRWQSLYAKALKGEKIDEPEDFDKEVELLKRDLSQNKGIEQEVSEEVIRKIFNESLLPLLKSIESKVSKLDELFLKKNIVITGLINGNYERLILKNLKDVNSILNNLVKGVAKGGTIDMDFTHQSFKKSGVNFFDSVILLKITFQNFAYKIEVLNKPETQIEKLYTDPISQSEIEKFANNIAKIELNTIKYELERNQK